MMLQPHFYEPYVRTEDDNYDLAHGPRDLVHHITDNRWSVVQTMIVWKIDNNTLLRELKASRGLGFGHRDDDSLMLEEDRDTSVE
tara:strand:+ start:1871 stop:2125 length:255 start_codon:yes stop_codon:yes gene_type:complete